MVDLFVFLFGLAVGSFLNVCIYRLPRDQSVVRPCSACPSCSQVIRWYDNIPLLSFILLKGRCRKCRARISPRYAAVELINAAVWVLIWQRQASLIEFFSGAVLFSVLLAVFFADLETGLIPDEFSLGGLAAGFVFAALLPERFGTQDWKMALAAAGIGAFVGGGLLYFSGLLGQFLFRKESMGLGDVKLLAMLGAFLGLPGVFFVFLIAPIAALPTALFERFIRKRETIPFGPYLALAGFAVYLWEQPLRAFFLGYS